MLFGERESRCTKCRFGWKTQFLAFWQNLKITKNAVFQPKLHFVHFISLQKHYEHMDGSVCLTHKVLCKQNNNLHAKCALYYWKTPKIEPLIQFPIKCALGGATSQCAHTLYEHMYDLLPLTHYVRWVKPPSKTRNGWFLKNSNKIVSLCWVSRPS